MVSVGNAFVRSASAAFDWMLKLPLTVVSPARPLRFVREALLEIETVPPTHCNCSRPLRLVNAVLLMVKSPAIQLLGALANVVRSDALEIVTPPELGVPAAHTVGVISRPQVPALHVGTSPGHAFASAQDVPHEVVRLR